MAAQKVVVAGSSISAGQMKDFWRQVDDGSITGTMFQDFLDHRPFKEKPITEAVKKAVAVLAFVATAIVPAMAVPMDPNEAFQDRQGLQVYGDFRTRVLPVLQPISSAPEASFTVSRFTKNANDSAIHKELPEQHLAEWHHVISLIGKQPNGEDGALLTNGYANIFYMRGVGGQVFAVSVLWFAVDRRWRVRAWHLGGGDDWDAGGQVFSCNSQSA